MHVLIMLALVPDLITGSICLKSPLSITGIPPMTSLFWPYILQIPVKGLKHRLVEHWGFINYDGMTILDKPRKCCSHLIEQKDYSVLVMSRGTLKVLWTVLPPVSNVAAKPLLAVSIAIFRSDLLESIVSIKNVFPQPPGALMKKTCLSVCSEPLVRMW